MTKSSKHFRQKTKTKSKIAGKINTAPHRLHDGDTAANASTFSGGAKEYFRRLHLEVLDSWIVCLNNRFSSEAFNRIELFERAVVGTAGLGIGHGGHMPGGLKPFIYFFIHAKLASNVAGHVNFNAGHINVNSS